MSTNDKNLNHIIDAIFNSNMIALTLQCHPFRFVSSRFVSFNFSSFQLISLIDFILLFYFILLHLLFLYLYLNNFCNVPKLTRIKALIE